MIKNGNQKWSRHYGNEWPFRATVLMNLLSLNRNENGSISQVRTQDFEKGGLGIMCAWSTCENFGLATPTLPRPHPLNCVSHLFKTTVFTKLTGCGLNAMLTVEMEWTAILIFDVSLTKMKLIRIHSLRLRMLIQVKWPENHACITIIRHIKEQSVNQSVAIVCVIPWSKGSD